jgi:hypothetical protein
MRPAAGRDVAAGLGQKPVRGGGRGAQFVRTALSADPARRAQVGEVGGRRSGSKKVRIETTTRARPPRRPRLRWVRAPRPQHPSPGLARPPSSLRPGHQPEPRACSVCSRKNASLSVAEGSEPGKSRRRHGAGAAPSGRAKRAPLACVPLRGAAGGCNALTAAGSEQPPSCGTAASKGACQCCPTRLGAAGARGGCGIVGWGCVCGCLGAGREGAGPSSLSGTP